MRSPVGCRRLPGGRVGVDLVPAADVLDLVAGLPPPPGTTRTGCRAARRTGSACRTSPRPEPPRPGCRAGAAPPRPASHWARSSSAASATSTQVGVERLADQARRPTSRPSSRETPIEMPTPGYVVRAVGGQGVVAPAGADRAVGLVPDQLGLVDGARVVVQPAGDPQVGDQQARARARSRRASPRRGRPGPRRESGAPPRGRAPASTNPRSASGDLGQGQARGGLLRGGAGLHQQRGDPLRPDLVQLVDDPQHRLDVGQPETEVEALGDLAVVDLDPERADRQLAEARRR